jgi:anion-transporting  ArsA/GET3 family ATPase
VLDRRLQIVTGKGGTGRSAVAASLALHAARRGQRVLAVAMADPLGLASHLRTGELGSDPVEARPGLHASAIDAGAAIDEYLRIRLRVPRLAVVTRAFRVLAETVPGIRDTVVIGKLLWEAARPRWDLVVADAPAAGQVLSFLRAPTTIEGLLPASRVRDQAAWMRHMLADEALTGIVVVATPEELPVTEAVETVEVLSRERLCHISAVVGNRVLPELAVPTSAVEAEPPGRRRDAAQFHLALAAEQETHLLDLQPTITFPLLFGIRTPGEVASRLADLWEEA